MKLLRREADMMDGCETRKRLRAATQRQKVDACSPAMHGAAHSSHEKFTTARLLPVNMSTTTCSNRRNVFARNTNCRSVSAGLHASM
jgi:hypothetical protein